MGGNPRRLEAWLVILGATSCVAWAVLMFGAGEVSLAALCSAGRLWPAPQPLSLNVALVLNSPGMLAADWALMFAAMMPPLVIAPLRHIRDRSFAKRRARAMLLFVAGYAGVWLAAGVVLEAMALVALLVGPTPLVCLGLAAAIALLWQVSPAKQWCLNRCHRRPHLAAFGAAADRDAFTFGLINGAFCVGACWALMLLTLCVGPGHMLAMTMVTLFVIAERIEIPAPLAWRWRGAGRALRIIAAQARMHLAQFAPRSNIREVSR
jgi:predicted metal-binding membrane protein